MAVEETPKFFVDDAVPSMDFLESLCNQVLDVKMIKNFGQHIQDSLLKESYVKRRASPRLTNIEKDRKPEVSKELIPVTPKESFIPEVVRGKSRESTLKRRASPRLKEIPESKRPYYGPYRKESCHHPDEEISKAPTTYDASKISCEPKMGDMQTWESSENRRFSPRLKGIRQNERPFYGPKCTAPQHCSVSNVPKQDFVNEVDVDNNGDTPLESGVESCKDNCLANGSGNRNAIVNVISSSSASKRVNSSNNWKDLDEKRWVDEIGSSRSIARVKQTIKIYNKYYLQFLRGVDEDVPSSTRPDLKAYSLMKKSKEVLYPEKRFGHLPGICVGYQFYSRCAMAAVGLHSHWLNGIDYMGTDYKKVVEFKGYKFPLAVAIVLSGQYEDDQDNSEEVVYTGQGGHDLLGKKHQIKDQEMTRGNLALQNNMKYGLPVRVVRGHKMKGKTVKVYTYDGLYKVVECWSDKGVSGFVVFKYRLLRLQGQHKLISNQVHFKENSSWVPRLPNLVCDDISGGQEVFPIPAINSVDDAPLTLKGFIYTKTIKVANNIIIPPDAVGCKCKGGKCKNPRTCDCAKLNGSDFPYVRKDGGRLIEARDVVVECGPNCGCGPSCINRISQQGIKYHLEVFRTEKKGWAVKTKDFIPSGAPVCEYIGVLRKTNELDSVAGNDYIFEIDCLQTMKEIGGRERRMGDVASASKLLKKMDKKTLESSTPEFCIDAGSVGNVARFINHSCEPNLFVQCVLSTHHDLRLARIVLFAADDIAPLQELTYDYGYALDSVIDSNGNIRQQPCHCGTAECRKRLF